MAIAERAEVRAHIPQERLRTIDVNLQITEKQETYARLAATGDPCWNHFVRAVQHGTEDIQAQAFAIIYERFYAPLVGFVTCKFRLDSEDTEQLVQDSLLKAWKALPQTQEDTKLSPWLFRITNNSCLDEIRHRTIIPIDALDIGKHEYLPGARTENAYQEVFYTDLAERALRTFKKVLTPHQAQTLTLQVFGQLSMDEIAEKMNTTRAGVKSTLFRARKTLRQNQPGFENQDQSVITQNTRLRIEEAINDFAFILSAINQTVSATQDKARIFMRYLRTQGYSPEEIGVFFEISAKTVQENIGEAHNHLQTHWRNFLKTLKPSPIEHIKITDAEIIDLRAQGLQNKQIARILGLNQTTIIRHVAYLIESGKVRRRKLTHNDAAELDNDVLALRKEGLKKPQIAAILTIPLTKVKDSVDRLLSRGLVERIAYPYSKEQYQTALSEITHLRAANVTNKTIFATLMEPPYSLPRNAIDLAFRELLSSDKPIEKRKKSPEETADFDIKVKTLLEEKLTIAEIAGALECKNDSEVARSIARMRQNGQLSAVRRSRNQYKAGPL
ncbi:MAG: sigma-70 family RNA polymerase sigma factor [Candidatus Blackburnbacteria bacterium]|nr:sigma-70 family RNA polymerase sigma factor [Candidatus Blackburnbacteria bacterium]